MSNLADFPGNCITNTHILHDFAEIAYIVCTYAVPTDTNGLPESTSPAQILDRLRNAEKQFRQNSILVALDPEKLELFTFYRKVDVVKDQRTILSKFGYVCRLNSCLIANKNAARILDLLKPESSRVYRLFATAILSSVQILPKTGEPTVTVGARIYLAPSTNGDHVTSGAWITHCPEWQIHRVNLQIIPSGQIILTVQNAKNARLHRLSDLISRKASQQPPLDSLMYLAPTGQIARYTGGVAGTRTSIGSKFGHTTSTGESDVRIAITQISVVSEWLNSRYPAHVADLSEATWWVQIEVPVLEKKNDFKTNISNSIVWKSLVWPSEMIFIFKRNGDWRSSAGRSVTESDPLKFVLDWYNGSAERNRQLARAQTSRDLKEDVDDDHIFADDTQFEDHYTPQVFGPPAFPASQMVYPTPPEAALAHQTPGVSSIDGLAPTPAPVLNASHADTEPFFDQEMPDVHEQQTNRAGNGFYDEDLFEEMPDDKFAPNTDADEPDWDFFDPSGFESSINAVATSNPMPRDSEQHEANNSVSAHEDITPDEGFPLMEISTQPKPDEDTIQDIDLTQSSPIKLDSIYGNELSLSPVIMHQPDYVGRPLAHSQDHMHTKNVEGSESFASPSDHLSTTRRRSSIFEGLPANSTSKNHDLRYSKHGKFWFENHVATEANAIPASRSNENKRPPSSGSDTSRSSSLNDSDSSPPVYAQEQLSTKRAWTEYHAESPVRDLNEGSDVDQTHIQADTGKVLTAIAAATGEDPFLVSIEPLTSARRRPNYSAQKTMMIAQVLVDQVSQSSLLREEHSLQHQQEVEGSLVDVMMDHSGGKTQINHATLSDLTSMPPKTATRITTLNNRLLCVNRTDIEIVARQTILPFWDTLGLQPYSDAKDLAAFCIHPGSTNVAEGCAAFLNRIADTYASCNLGTHNIGRSAGLANDGLLAWTPQTIPGPNLKQQCQRLGAAIGGTGMPSESTVVVYIISPSNDPICYREVCHAFTSLFETFVDTSEGTRRSLELVLQIVPLNFVASADTIVIANQDAYLELALEVYNRVPMKQATTTTPNCGSAVVLEPQLRSPTFELSNSVISPFSKDGPCLHLAYSYSLDKRWLVATWSDERGTLAFTMSYCMNVAEGSRAHPKREVFRNIWDVSHDIMHQSRVKWRLVVAYTGYYDTEDIVEWQHLMSQGAEERRMMGRLMLLSIDLNPGMFVGIPTATGKPAHQTAASQAPNVSGTPVSTPQAHITSPDQLVAATPTSSGVAHTAVATPPEHNLDTGYDTEITLINSTDQSWAVLLSYGLNQSTNFLDVRPAAASGYLMKRTGSKEESKGLQLLGVNLVAAPRPQPTSLGALEKETILQDIMEQYRGLVTLAISRGCIDKNNDCVPWHIATALKGSRVLGEAM